MPTRTLVTVRMMLTKHGRQNAAAFVAGNWVWRVALGIVLLSALGFDATGVAKWAGGTLRAVSGVAAVVLALLAVAEWHFGHRLNIERMERLSQRLDGLSPTQVLGATLATQWIPGVQWLLVIAGCGVIHSSGLSAVWQLIVLVLYAAAQLALVASPLFMSHRVLARGEALRRNADHLRDRLSARAFVVPAAFSVICALIAAGVLSR